MLFSAALSVASGGAPLVEGDVSHLRPVTPHNLRLDKPGMSEPPRGGVVPTRLWAPPAQVATDTGAEPRTAPTHRGMPEGARDASEYAVPWRDPPVLMQPSDGGTPGLDMSDVPADQCAVSVMRNDDGRVEIFAVGPDDAVYRKVQLSVRCARLCSGPPSQPSRSAPLWRAS